MNGQRLAISRGLAMIAFHGPVTAHRGVLNATYRLDALLTTGGAAAVFRATHLALQKPFAVKVLLPPPGATRFFEQFRVEAETLGRLSHPAIVRITDFGIDPEGEGLPYLVMELVERPTLDTLCGDTPMPLAKAAPILDTIASAIDAAHAAGIVHGDIATRNVMVISDANGERPVLIDFGLARAAVEAAPGLSGDVKVQPLRNPRGVPWNPIKVTISNDRVMCTERLDVQPYGAAAR